MINLQIVDDHRMVVESLSKLINESGVATVTHAYYDLKSCREGLAKELPDVFLLDIALPDGDGVNFCAEIKKQYPELKIIMLTTYKEFNIAKRALHNGALGYILKNAESEEMLIGIEAVNRGEQFLCEEIDILLENKKNQNVIWLSNREKEILQYVADGLTTKEIADIISRTTENVRTFRRNLLIKLQARNVAELIKKGYEMKFIW
ncbi:response regulator transcription factor [Prevotella sp. 10(H)]|uniref:response regulator n=1 Tax=Prevotella sp. 10(H) TaxID=1158294 RepID=UPI0009DFC248|nr:response regulator transcription factor [Prevotella sp. 10(H)]